MSGISRRKFITTSAKGAALVSIPLLFRANPLAALGGPMSESGRLGDYYSRFGVDENSIRKVMAAGMSKGGDYCDLYFQHSISSTIGLEDNIVNRAYSNIDMGLGIRVLNGEQTGYSFTEDLSPKAMEAAAKTAANIASLTQNAPPQEFKLFDTPNYYQIKTRWDEIGIDQKIPYLQRMNEMAQALDSRIVKTRVFFVDRSGWILQANSDGRIMCDYQPMGVIYLACIAQDGDKRESGSKSLAGRFDIATLTEEKLQEVVSKAVDSTIKKFEAVKPQAGEMEVVLSSGGSGILLHEAIGHGMEADFNRKGISIFADKINKPVAESFVNIVDDGTTPYHRGAVNCDDECENTEKTYLVRNGILESYLHDRISAKYYGVKPTGNGRRESFRFAPMPRMRSTYMEAGPHTPEEIIASVKKGLYCEDFTNGEVAIGAGDFTFYVSSGYMIEGGKLTKPVKDINIIGNGPDVLKKIVMVGNDPKLDSSSWTCGKDGQSVPVSQGLPTVKVSSITVGGLS